MPLAEQALVAEVRGMAASHHPSPTAGAVVIKTAITHTITYFLCGMAAFLILDYPTLIYQSVAGTAMRPLGDRMLMAGPLLQPIRGILFGLLFYMLREVFFRRKHGWLTMWAVLAGFGIFGTFAAPGGSIEGLIYTVLPLSLHLKLLPETLLQSFLLSWITFQWVNHAEKKWPNWVMGVAFALVLFFPTLGLIAGGANR